MAKEIGNVEDVQSSAFGTPPQEEKRELGQADGVHVDEVVETIRDGALRLRFLDNTDFRLGSNAKVMLDKFVYDPDAKAGELGVDLGRGIFRMVTGDIPSESIQINTPVATMGVRGTDWVGLLTANAFIVFVIQGSIWIKPLFGDNVQEYIVNALETVSVSLSGRVTFGVDRPDFDPGLGADILELLTIPQAGGDPLGPGGDSILQGGQGSFSPFNPANIFQLIRVILDRAAPRDPTDGPGLPENFVFIVAPGANVDSNILLNVLGDTPVETPAVPGVPVIILITTPEGVVTPVVAIVTPTAIIIPQPGGGPPIVIPIDPGDPPFGLPDLFTPNIDIVDLGDIGDVLNQIGLSPGDLAVLEDAINNDGYNITEALSGDDTVVLPNTGDDLQTFLDGVLFNAGPGDDTVTGGDASDSIAGGVGSNDTLFGGDNDDLLFGDNGDGSPNGDNDLLYGDAGFDTLAGEGGDDEAYGGEDGDELYGDGIFSTAFGNSNAFPNVGPVTLGSDRLFGGESSDLLYGDSGGSIEPIISVPGTVTVNGGADELYGGAQSDTLYGDAGTSLTAENVGASVSGGNDTLFGDFEDDAAAAGSGQFGNDVLYGDAGTDINAEKGGTANGGNDLLYGGGEPEVDPFGNDMLIEDDTLYGDAGGDISADGAQSTANGGDDTLHGLAGADVLYGDAGNNIASKDGATATGGKDLLYGSDAGESEEFIDVLYGDAGNDLIADSSTAMGGDDAIHGAETSSILYGDVGNDITSTNGGFAYGGHDVLYGTGDGDPQGEDEIYGDAGRDISATEGGFASGGNDTLDGSGNSDTLFGDAGRDLNGTEDGIASGGKDVIYGGFGGDFIYGDAGGSLSAGTDGNAIGEDDLIYGGGSNDTIYGDAGSNIAVDNTGTGTVRGGDDTAYGEGGEDVIYGDAGGFISSGSDGSASGGEDLLYGGTSDDTLYGDSGGNDNMRGGDDTLYGDRDEDLLYGGSGNDTLYGDGLDSSGIETAGMDTLYGGLEDDFLFGGMAEDSLFGNAGADNLYGGTGLDVDTFFYKSGDGGLTLPEGDVIFGFQDGADLIGLFDGLQYDEGTSVPQGRATFLPVEDILGTGSDQTGVLVVSDGAGGFEQILAVIQGVDIDDLDFNDIAP